jgi:threonine/homoserine/homoserine lactone efflux protein
MLDLTVFVLLSAAFIVIPGPNVMVIVATSLRHGRRRGLQTVAGTSLAMVVQLLVAGLGTTLFVGLLVEGLQWLKWAGVCYLVYLGLQGLLADREIDNAHSALFSFQRGFWVSLTNPKTIFFFSAFLPQFVTPESDYATRIALLSALFWILAVVFDSAYALLSAALVRRLPAAVNSRSWYRLTGLVYLGAGAALASTGRV